MDYKKLRAIYSIKINGKKVEKTIIIIMSAIIVLTFLLIVAAGPLSKKILGSSKVGCEVEFQRLLRHKRVFPLKIKFSPVSLSADYRIRINKCFFNSMKTIRIVPEPDVTFIGKTDYLFSFNKADFDDQAIVVFYVKPLITGNTKLVIGNENGLSKEMDVFIYP